MRRIDLEIAVTQAQPQERLRVLANVDACGRVTAELDTEIHSREFHPLMPPYNGWLEGAWKREPWLAAVDPDAPPITVRTPKLYFGTYRFQTVTRSVSGNETTGEELAVFVNSGPDMDTGFKLASIADDGRPVFGFKRPGQWA